MKLLQLDRLISLREAMNRYLTTVTGRSATYRAKSRDLELFLEHCAKEIPSPSLPDLSRAVIERFLELRLQRERASTVSRRLSTLKHFFRLLEENVIPGLNVRRFINPCREVRSPEIEPPRPQWLTTAELNRTLEATHQGTGFIALRNQLAIFFLYYTGLRSEEVRSLTFANLSLGLSELRDFRRKGNRWATLPLAEQVTIILEEYLPRWEETLASEIVGWFYTPVVLRSAYPLILSTVGAQPGHPLSYRLSAKQLWTICSETGERAGVTGLRPHRLRHTCAHEMISRGVPLQVVQKFLGHTDINTTARYMTPSDDEMRAATNKL